MNKKEKNLKLDYTVDNKWSTISIHNVSKRELR